MKQGVQLMENVRRDLLEIMAMVEKISYHISVAPEGCDEIYIDGSLGDAFNPVKELFDNWYIQLYNHDDHIRVVFKNSFAKHVKFL